MTKRKHSPQGASKSYVEQGWDLLTDEQLLEIQWTTDDPLSLLGLQTSVPANLGRFQIELEYRLPKEAEPVPCGHCPQHQKHWHGFVLKDEADRRYLLGSRCGPQAYGADYRLESSGRARAEQRSIALKRWHSVRAELPDEIEHFVELQKSPAAQMVRRNYAAFECSAPGALQAIRDLRPYGLQGLRSLSIFNRKRDHAAEQRIEQRFLAEVALLADLPLRRSEFNDRRRDLIEELNRGKAIFVTEERDLGHLMGADWLLSPSNPAVELANRVRSLRGLYAKGGTNQYKTTREIKDLSTSVQREIAACEEAFALLSAASSFFDPGHLSRLAEWLNSRGDGRWSAKANGNRLVVTENGRETEFAPGGG